MSQRVQEFDKLQETFQHGGADAALEELVQFLREQQRYHELFEVLKMQARQQLGLEIVPDPGSEDLSETTRNELEDRLLEACKEVGLGLMHAGKIREGWMYLRPIGDKGLAESIIRQTPVTEENLDELVEVCIGEGVSPAYGFSLVLEHFGTCNSITAYETQISHLPRADQQAAAQLLVRHLHEELLRNLRDDIARREGQPATGETVLSLVQSRDWLFTELTYHIDTTHLASVIRFARVLESEAELRLALDLVEYGKRLHSQFQYQGDEPFGELYPSSELYFAALLGERVDEAVAYFGKKAEEIDAYYQGTAAIEFYIDLLARVGRIDEAIAAVTRFIAPGTRTMGIAPSLFELCRRQGNFAPMIEACRERDDLLGYVTALLHQGDVAASQ